MISISRLAVRLDALRAFRAAICGGADLVIVFGLMCYALLFRCEGRIRMGMGRPCVSD